MMDLLIWRDIAVRYRDKIIHIKIGGKVYRRIISDFGDLPVARFNDITKKWEDVENRRGRAYAKRRDIGFRRKED